MPQLLDLIVVAIITVFIILTAVKGFVKSMISVICFVLAFYLSMAFSPLFAQGVYDGFIKKPMEDKIESTVQIDKDNIEISVNDAWEKMPKYITSIADNFGVTKQSVSNTIIKNSLKDKETLVSNIVDDVARPVVVPILKTLFYIILFFILNTVLRLISRPIVRIFKLPIIGGLNRFLGGVLGFVKGLVAAALFCVCVKLIINFTQNGFLIFTNQNIDNTIIFKYFCNII